MNGTDFCETEWEGTAKTDKLIRQLFGEIPIKEGVKKKKRKHDDIAIQSPKRKKVSAVQQSEKHQDETLKHEQKSQDDEQVTTKAMFVKKKKNKKKSKNEAVGNGEMNEVTSVLNEKGNRKKSDKNKYKHSAVKNNDNDHCSQTGKAKNNLTKDKLNLKKKDTSEYENVNKKGRKKGKVTSSQSREENSAISKDSKGNNLKRKSKQNLEVNTGDMPSKPKKSKNKYLHLAISAKRDKGTTPEDTPVSLSKKRKHRRAKKKKLASNNYKASKISSTSPGKSTKQQSTSPSIIAEDDVYENQKQTVTAPTKKSNKQPTSSLTKSPFNITKLQSLLDKSVKNDMNTPSKHEKLELQDKQLKLQDKKKQNDEDREPQNLKERMLQKLKSARFRHLNEQLYTISGSEAYKLFQKDPEAFQVYHKGFQTQVIKWPENPLDRMVAYINQRPKTEVVADFGCGDAELSSRLPHKVHSFDLIAVNPRVTACDMADVPLRSGSVDVGVFCLSLMGTNLVEYLIEAHRVLKQRGTLLIAEVLSRFEKVGIFVRKMQKLGFILLEKDTSNKMFVWFEFQKAANYDKDMLPHIELQPCVYKKR